MALERAAEDRKAEVGIPVEEFDNLLVVGGYLDTRPERCMRVVVRRIPRRQLDIRQGMPVLVVVYTAMDLHEVVQTPVLEPSAVVEQHLHSHSSRRGFDPPEQLHLRPLVPLQRDTPVLVPKTQIDFSAGAMTMLLYGLTW